MMAELTLKEAVETLAGRIKQIRGRVEEVEAQNNKNYAEAMGKLAGLEQVVGELNRTIDRAVQTRLDSALADPVFLRKLAIAQRESREETAERIKEDIREALAEHYQIPPGDVVPLLIEQVYRGRVIAKKPREKWLAAIEAWLKEAESKMAEAINEQLLKRAGSKVEIAPYARLLVMEGLDPSSAIAIRERLAAEEVFQGLLKKTR